MPLELDSDNGYFTLIVKVKGANQEVSRVEVQLDLYEAHNAAAAIADQFPGDSQPVEQAQAWIAWLASKGVPPLSHGDACVVANEIRKEVEAFKKKHGLHWESPDSADSSTPPPTPEASPS